MDSYGDGNVYRGVECRDSEIKTYKVNLDEVDGKKHTITNRQGSFYFWTGPSDLMITVPYENRPENAEQRAMLETICRISSKALKGRLTLDDIVEQMRKGDSGRCTLLSEMARCIEEYQPKGGE